MERRRVTEDSTPEIIIAEIDKSSRETGRVALATYEGTPTFSIWVWYRTPSGELRPGKGGVVVGLRDLPSLAEALAAALATARANGRLNSRSEAITARWAAIRPLSRLSRARNYLSRRESPHERAETQERHQRAVRRAFD